MGQVRHLHELDCPSRFIPGEIEGAEGVADEDVEARCSCPRDGRFLNPRARPVADPSVKVTSS